ncbi:MAG TPA: transposase, partial [Thermodesulfobacteriota bacterium]|nr:transposase [Thermodesulfobacteriota bacterium]
NNTAESPKYLAKSGYILADAQRVLSRKKVGTRAREKAKARVARVHRKVRNQRNDFLHKVSRQLIDKYDLIAYEDLRIKDMMQNGSLAKPIGDCSWGRFLAMVEYKAEDAGKHAIAVDPQETHLRYAPVALLWLLNSFLIGSTISTFVILPSIEISMPPRRMF